MSVSPLQNSTKPSPVPGPSTLIETFGATSSLKSSATRLEIGWTVDDPEIVIVPVRSLPPVVPVSGCRRLTAAARSGEERERQGGRRRPPSHFLRLPMSPPWSRYVERPGGPFAARMLGAAVAARGPFDERNVNDPAGADRPVDLPFYTCAGGDAPRGPRARGRGGRRRAPRPGAAERRAAKAAEAEREAREAVERPAREAEEERRIDGARPVLDARGRPARRAGRPRRVREPRARGPPRQVPAVARRAAASRPARGRPSGHVGARSAQRRGRDRGAEPMAPRRRDPRRRGRSGAARRARRDRGAPARGRPSRLRLERLARAEDAGRLDPGGRGDDRDRRASRIPPWSPGSPRSSSARRCACRGSSRTCSTSPGSRPGARWRSWSRSTRCVRDEVERFEGPAAEAGVALAVDTEAVPPVRGSARELALMVRNLVDNAIRYTRPGGRVDVRLAAADGEVVLTVADTGVGIPRRELAADLRALLPGGPGSLARDRRDGARPVDREARRREPRRHGDRSERARRGLHVRGPPARRAVSVSASPRAGAA